MSDEHVSASRAKAQFSALIGRVFRGKRVVIEKRGRPVAALVSIEELSLLGELQGRAETPRGALALVGAWRDAGDRRIDRVVREIYRDRLEDRGRPVDLED